MKCLEAHHAAGGFPLRHVAVPVMLLTILAVSPAALGWGAKGFREPDTLRDTQDGYMWRDGPDGATRQVYFNGFLAQGRGPQPECSTQNVLLVNIFVSCSETGCGYYELVVTRAKPCVQPPVGPGSNVAGIQHSPYPMQPFALLGVWKDCNGDGYIGYGDLGLWEYRATLLTLPGATSACAASVDPNPIPYNWYPSHNDGTWVREFLPLAWNQWGAVQGQDANNPGIPYDLNVYDVNDSAARVWADWGLPDAPGRNNCNVNPPPRDTVRQTGGIVEWIDCFDDFRLTESFNLLMEGAGQSRLSFSDSPRDQSRSSSDLNQRNPWGSNGDDPFMETCSGDEIVVIPEDDDPDTDDGDPVFGWGHNVSVPAPGEIHEDGSVAGQLREAYYHSTWMECDGGQAPVQQQASEAPYMVESSAANQVGARRQSDLAFLHYADPRPAPPFAGNHRATPDDLGLRHASPNGLWRASGDAALTRPPLVTREDVQLAPVQYLTYYAKVGPDATSRYNLRTPGPTGVYGAGACTSGMGPGAPDAGGWVCDPTKWWPDGSMPRSGKLQNGEAGVRVGETFQLRDVDCFDESADGLREEGLPLAFLTGSTCAYAPR